MNYRIIYKRVFNTQKEALKALREVVGKATNPSVKQGKSGAWLVVLYECATKEVAEKGIEHYRASGLTVYLQKVV